MNIHTRSTLVNVATVNIATRFLPLLCLWFAAATAWAQTPVPYTFSVGQGTAADMTGSTVVCDGTTQMGSGKGGYTDTSSAEAPIGFPFYFKGRLYTTFSANTNGVMSLDTLAPLGVRDGLRDSRVYPILAPFWDFLRVSGGANGCGKPRLHYVRSGAAPNRVLVVEWRDVDMVRNIPAWGTFQVRLYEGSNRIEFWYGETSHCDRCNLGRGCGSTAASIGIASSAADFISITLTSVNAMPSTKWANDTVNIGETPLGKNWLFTFRQCVHLVTGRVGAGNGGTPAMADGDTLFQGFQSPVGGGTVYRPFTLRMVDSACSGLCTLRITGAAASDYVFEKVESGALVVDLSAGHIDTVAIGFNPTAMGVRYAVLEITGSDGIKREYVLAAGGAGPSSAPLSSEDIASLEIAPTPAHGDVALTYRLAKPGHVQIDLYDLLGKHLRTITAGTADATVHTVRFNLGGLPAGSYFVRLNSGAAMLSRQLQVR